jgi:hypothetical protein
MIRHVSKHGSEADRQLVAKARPSGWLAVVAVLLAVIAIAGAAWAMVRQPAAPAPVQPGSQQVADAKGRACAAFNAVRTAVSLQTHADLGRDPVAVQAVAANARLSMVAGGSAAPPASRAAPARTARSQGLQMSLDLPPSSGVQAVTGVTAARALRAVPEAMAASIRSPRLDRITAVPVAMAVTAVPV